MSLKNLGSTSITGSSFAIKKITESWGDSTVIWDNKPDAGSTLSNGTTTDGWIEFDVTSTVQEFIDDPSGNHGFEISRCENMSMATEVASSKHPEESLRPKLTVEGITHIGATNETIMNNNPILVNSNKGIVNIFVPFNAIHEISIVDAIGRTLYKAPYIAGNKWLRLSPELSTGINFLQVKSSKKTYVKSFYLE